MKEPEQTIMRSPELTRIAPNKTPHTVASGSRSAEAGRESPALHAQTHPMLKVGDVLKERFIIEERIGEGGMGVVFRAVDLRRQEVHDRDVNVAIKVLHPNLSKDPVVVMGLERESKRARHLAHPNIITVYDFDRDGDYWFLSMEFLVGKSLKAIIAQSSIVGGMSIESAWPIIRGMGQALAYAHRHGIVHSDFKPANVFVTDSEEVKVLDFGIAAKIEYSEQGENEKTVFKPRKFRACTPDYACYEVMVGESADPRDDIYAFGCVVYELLTGIHPYGKLSGIQIHESVRAGNKLEAAAVRGLSSKQWNLLKATLKHERNARTGDLQEWLEQFDPNAQRFPYLTSIIATVLAMITGLVIWWVSSQPSFLSTISSGKRSDKGDVVSESEARIPVPDQGGLKIPPVPIAKDEEIKPETEEHPTPGNRFPLQMATSADGLIELRVQKPAYRIGENLQLNFRISSPGYVRINHVSASGEINELLPNPFQTEKKLKSGIDYAIPPKTGSFEIEISGPPGVDKIIAVFSKSALQKTVRIVDANGAITYDLLPEDVSIASVEYEVRPK